MTEVYIVGEDPVTQERSRLQKYWKIWEIFCLTDLF